MEILRSEASLAMQLLNELLNLHDGFSHEEWLRRSRRTMIEVFPPEDAFTILGASGVDMENVRASFYLPLVGNFTNMLNEPIWHLVEV